MRSQPLLLLLGLVSSSLLRLLFWFLWRLLLLKGLSLSSPPFLVSSASFRLLFHNLFVLFFTLLPRIKAARTQIVIFLQSNGERQEFVEAFIHLKRLLWPAGAGLDRSRMKSTLSNNFVMEKGANSGEDKNGKTEKCNFHSKSQMKEIKGVWAAL